MELYISSKKHGVFVVKIDYDDFEKIKNKTIGISNCDGWYYAYITINRKTTRLHRYLMGNPIDKFIDHIDGDTLNNSRSNLRVCDNAENIRNSKISKRNSSGYKGVSWCKRTKKYRVNIMVNRVYVSNKYYDNVEEAAKAYNELASSLHKNFCKLNKIKNA